MFGSDVDLTAYVGELGSEENIEAMLVEIERFKHDYVNNLDDAFMEYYGFDFNQKS